MQKSLPQVDLKFSPLPPLSRLEADLQRMKSFRIFVFFFRSVRAFLSSPVPFSCLIDNSYQRPAGAAFSSAEILLLDNSVLAFLICSIPRAISSFPNRLLFSHSCTLSLPWLLRSHSSRSGQEISLISPLLTTPRARLGDLVEK